MDNKTHDADQKLIAYHEQHMGGGQECYFSHVNGRLQPQSDQIHWLTAHRRHTARLLNIQSSDCFVDIGCGEGYLTQPLASRAHHSFGFDFVTSALDMFTNQPGYDQEQILLSIAAGDAIPLPDAIADKLLCNHVLEHVLDDDAILHEFHRILRPGGLVLIGVPLALSPQIQMLMRVRRLLRPKSRMLQLEKVAAGKLVPELIGIQSHIRFYSLASVRDLLERNGFEMVEAVGIGISVRGSIRKQIRRHRLLFNTATTVAQIFPAIGDGVLALGKKI